MITPQLVPLVELLRRDDVDDQHLFDERLGSRRVLRVARAPLAFAPGHHAGGRQVAGGDDVKAARGE
mgnify:CR=1 FL=1